jgi:hypothetical protein
LLLALPPLLLSLLLPLLPLLLSLLLAFLPALLSPVLPPILSAFLLAVPTPVALAPGSVTTPAFSPAALSSTTPTGLVAAASLSSAHAFLLL